MKINYKSDFKISEVSTLDDLSTPFNFGYRSSTSVDVIYSASFDGTTYTNCIREEDGSLTVIFNNHALPPGHLMVTREYMLADDNFADGVCNKISVESLDITLSTGQSDAYTATVEVLPNYTKGDSAYQTALNNGFEGTEEEWLEALGTSGNISAPINVIGVTVGNLSSGDSFDSGTSVESILRSMLSREIDVTATLPYATFAVSGEDPTTVLEVGSITTLNLEATYHDGAFIGESGYDYTLAAGCPQGTITYYRDTEALNFDSDSQTLLEGSISYKATIGYGASTATPKTNFGNVSEVSISAGVATSDAVNFTAKYKYFIGGSTTSGSLTSAQVRALTSSGFLNIDTTTTLNNTYSATAGSDCIIAVPSKYKLSGVYSSLGTSMLDEFSDTFTVDVATEQTTTTYRVYRLSVSRGASSPQEFKNIEISKA